MNELPGWIQALVAVAGAVVSAGAIYVSLLARNISIQISAVRESILSLQSYLESRITTNAEEITRLRAWKHEISQHPAFRLDLPAKLDDIDGRLDLIGERLRAVERACDRRHPDHS